MESLTRKGILLAGGANSRLYPITQATPKSLLPVYDKPLIYYSLAALMLAGLRDILIITTPAGEEPHRRLLGDGRRLGLRLSYLTQSEPRGIADAFVIGREFIGGAPSALMLSDNFFHGGNVVAELRAAAAMTSGAAMFSFPVSDPRPFSVVEVAANGEILSLEEKPANPKSSLAVPGCFFYDGRACEFAATLRPSARGELEITDLNLLYLRAGALTARRLRDDVIWFDAGAADSLAAATDYVRAEWQRSGRMVCCPEEIAWRQGRLDDEGLAAAAARLKNSPYGEYLLALKQQGPAVASVRAAENS